MVSVLQITYPIQAHSVFLGCTFIGMSRDTQKLAPGHEHNDIYVQSETGSRPQASF